MESVTLSLVRDLTPDLLGRRLSSPSITYDGAAIALAMPPGAPVTHTFAPGFTREVYPEQLGSFTGDVLIWGKGGLVEVALHDVPLDTPRLQTFPKGQLLIASASGPGPNGRVYALNGEFLRSLSLGYAMNHAFISAEGDIWIGYIDEGVFGGGAGASGLVRFNGQGEKLWGFNENRGSARPIDDCYALNVSRQTVWFSAYTDFDVVRIENGGVGHWRNPLSGHTAIAVHNEDILLFGGYKDEHTKCRLARFGADTLEDIKDLALRFPDDGLLSDVVPRLGGAPAPPFWAIGRDDALHLFKDDRWYRVTVQDAVAALTVR